MIRYILTKILNKYKLYLCLMIGNISIIMIFAVMMMFRDGSRMKLIQRGFTKQYEETGSFPASIFRESNINPDAMGDSSDKTISDDLNAYENSWKKYIDAPVLASQRFVYYKAIDAKYSYRKAKSIAIGYLEDGKKESGSSVSEHYNIVSGADYHEDISKYLPEGVTIPEDAVPCLVSEYTADAYDIVPGEIISFDRLIYSDEASDKPLLTLYVSGVISEKEGDYFWNKSLEEMGLVALVEKKDFCEIADAHTKDVHYKMNVSFDYRYINTDNIYQIESVLNQFKKKDSHLIENITPVISDYEEESKSVGQMLYVIVLPLIILVLIFIGMIAVRIIDSERGELGTLRNRGLSRFKLIGMYLIQSIILAMLSVPFGVGLGFLFGKMVAGVDDFMGFNFISNEISVRDYRFTISMLFVGLVGAFIAVIVMMVPVLSAFRKKKSRRAGTALPAWEKYFLDIILLVVSVYLLVNYNKQIPTLSVGVMNGEGIDPIIFIDSTLFLFACGMLMLRIIFYIVRFIYKLGEKKFGPVSFAGILEILRTRKASSVISIFLVMTVAMSVFNANMARTINANKEARLQYEGGADVRIQENWPLQLMRSAPGAPIRWKYHEPSFDAYNKLKDDGTFSCVTKVLCSSRAQASTKGTEKKDVTFMAINTKEFGRTAKLRNDLSEEHWYNYLNALAADPDGVIISTSLAKAFGLKKGDSMVIGMKEPKVCNTKEPYASMNVKVSAIVDAWPGYNNYNYYNDENGKLKETENYLVVTNYGTAHSAFGDLPYEVWGSVESNDGASEYNDGIDEDEVREKLTAAYGEADRTVGTVFAWKTEVKKEKSTAIIQITNGLFTADFLVALLLCIIGYLIYWITSIRDRELLFGIYRAQGITRKEINRMLIIEQAFLSFMAILAGIVAGILASKFFAKVFAAVYLPQKHSVSVFESAYSGDMLRLAGVLILVVMFCTMWIRRIIRGLNITEALKLGEDS